MHQADDAPSHPASDVKADVSGVFRAEVVLDKDVSRPDLSLNDEIFNLQWKVLWKARSKVCRERFNTPLKVDTNTAVKRAESQSLISPGDHEGASAAYQELTVLLSKVVLPPSDKARRALGKIALIAPDTVSWERQLASVISGSKTREAAERKMDGCALDPVEMRLLTYTDETDQGLAVPRKVLRVEGTKIWFKTEKMNVTKQSLVTLRGTQVPPINQQTSCLETPSRSTATGRGWTRTKWPPPHCLPRLKTVLRTKKDYRAQEMSHQ